MKIGDLVRWSDAGRGYFVGHIGIIIRLQNISGNQGAWVRWNESEYGPQEAWTPIICIEMVNEEG
jgi:hypothetical protein